MTTRADTAAVPVRAGDFPGYGDQAPLVLADVNPKAAAESVGARFRDGSMDGFADALASVRNCAHPIRLHGSSTTIDAVTGEVLSTFSSADAPLGVLHVPCGNRRAAVCPACSRTYARDTFAFVRAGVTGGKTVPEQVADNPLLFVTLTAPSFGPVHRASTGNARCRPRTRAAYCPHGRTVSCMARHDDTDPQVGAPMCAECHDTASAVIWQWYAPELWRRTTIAIRRALAHRLHVPESRLGQVASIQYAKVAEYQARGLVHFHALIRLDGPAEDGIGSPAPPGLDGAALARLVRDTVPSVSLTAEPIDDQDQVRVLRWGQQLDVRVVRLGARSDDPTGPLSGQQVAGYLAKYATKDAGSIVGHHQRRPHLRTMQTACAALAARAARHHAPEHDYQRMGKWAHCLGFRGHFSTKSRRYSITLGALRRARIRWQRLAAQSRRTGEPLDTADLERRLLADDEDETTLVVGSWTYAGTGWSDATEEALALAAANRAREYDQWRAERNRKKRTAGDVWKG